MRGQIIPTLTATQWQDLLILNKEHMAEAVALVALWQGANSKPRAGAGGVWKPDPGRRREIAWNRPLWEMVKE